MRASKEENKSTRGRYRKRDWEVTPQRPKTKELRIEKLKIQRTYPRGGSDPGNVVPWNIK